MMLNATFASDVQNTLDCLVAGSEGAKSTRSVDGEFNVLCLGKAF
jgi:hypothetical protein